MSYFVDVTKEDARDIVRWSQKSTMVKTWAQVGVTLCLMLPPDVHLQ